MAYRFFWRHGQRHPRYVYFSPIPIWAAKLSIENQGEHNFVVRGVDSDGKVKLLVNEIGSYSGTVANRDYFMVIVESEGDWCISW